MTTFYVVPNGTSQIVTNQYPIMIENDQNIVKGALWTFAAFKIGSLALAAGLSTLYTSPLIFLPPATLIPLGFGLATSVLSSMTGDCLNNAAYHLGSRKFVVLQTASAA